MNAQLAPLLGLSVRRTPRLCGAPLSDEGRSEQQDHVVDVLHSVHVYNVYIVTRPVLKPHHPDGNCRCGVFISSMVYIVRLQVRGVLFYQGESNEVINANATYSCRFEVRTQSVPSMPSVQLFAIASPQGRDSNS